MTGPELSPHFRSRRPSDIRLAQIEFARRQSPCEAINVAIGNVSLPMHPAMQERMRNLGGPESPFKDGVVAYSATVGTAECQRAFRNVIASSGAGAAADGLFVQVTDGGSQAMELAILGVCGPAGTGERPLLLIDPAYTNYASFAERLGRRTVSVPRVLQDDGRFTLPDPAAIEDVVRAEKPGALLVIPYDNPTGQFYDHAAMVEMGRLCVRHGLWMVSDEAYRELFYAEASASSIWRIDEKEVPGITGRRISIESASKVWNACGLRIGALVTDHEEFHRRGVAEQTANLCANVIGQHVFGALAHESHAELRRWYERQRGYYRELLGAFAADLRARLPGVIVSSPDAAIYCVVDVRAVVGPGFDSGEFVLWCAREGQVQVDGRPHTLLVAPMAGFFAGADQARGRPGPGRTQMRIAGVETPERMKLVPGLFAELLQAYEASRRSAACWAQGPS